MLIYNQTYPTYPPNQSMFKCDKQWDYLTFATTDSYPLIWKPHSREPSLPRIGPLMQQQAAINYHFHRQLSLWFCFQHIFPLCGV